MTKVRDKQRERGPLRISHKTVDHLLTELLDTVVDDIPFAPNLVAGIMADAASVIEVLRTRQPAPSPAAVFAPHLRNLGFTKTRKSTAGGERMDEWTRRDPADRHGFGRILTVQIWALCGHRVSHMVYRDPGTWLRGWGDTVPTDFSTPDELTCAVTHESTRMDNKLYAEVTP